MPFEGSENRLSWEGKSLKRIMIERQSYSARLKKPGVCFSSPSIKKSEKLDDGHDFEQMMLDISENVSNSNRVYSNHKTKATLNIKSLQNTFRSSTENLVKPTPVFKSKFKESFITPRSTISQDEANGSMTARSISQARSKYAVKIKRSIPCLSFQAPQNSSDKESRIMSEKLVLFFHANGEDLSHLSDFLSNMRNSLNISVLAMEYPGYGVYEGEPSEDQILEDAEGVLDFVLNELSIKPSSIVVVGRSIGSGPAIHITSKARLGGLILISPFTSIKAVIRDKVGLLISKCIRERFNNLAKIQQVQCKVKIIHGLKDELVKPEHAKLLAGSLSFIEAKLEDPEVLTLLPEMGHAVDNPLQQVFRPIYNMCESLYLTDN